MLPVPAAWLDSSLELRSFAGALDPAGQSSSVGLDLAPLLPLAPVHLKAVRAPAATSR